MSEKQTEMSAGDLAKSANALAIGALRFFLLKYTRNTIIAFDFKDALKAEGETGPYCQYAVVRIRGIRTKGSGGWRGRGEGDAGVRGEIFERAQKARTMGIAVAEWLTGSRG